MSKVLSRKPVSIALGTAVTLTLASVSVSQAAENPFSMEPLSTGYMMLAEGKSAEGKCGEGKCGGGKKGKRCGMSKMDADGDGSVSKDEFMKGHEAKFDQIDSNSDGVIDPAERQAFKAKKKKAMGGEGKCGEGKCGGNK